MKRFMQIAAGFSMLAGLAFAGEGRSVAIATNGGQASANATATGNAVSEAIAGASNGGRAIANSDAFGNFRGLGISRAVATADRGLAVSNSRADARGDWFSDAVADSESIAATIGGVAVSNSDAISRGRFGGRALSRSRSTSLSRFGEALSNSRAISSGAFGGEATSYSDALSDTFGGRSVSNVEAISDGRSFGRAHSDGIGVSVSGPRRFSRANVYAEGRASRFGRANSRSAVARIQR